MIVVAVVRISGIHTAGSIDETWEVFWQCIEASISVTMISLTAFRSLFVANASSKERKNKIIYKERLWYPRKQSKDSQDIESLPSVPSATLTGMRTFIRGNERASVMRLDDDDDESTSDANKPLPMLPSGIYVTHGLHTEIDTVRNHFSVPNSGCLFPQVLSKPSRTHSGCRV